VVCALLKLGHLMDVDLDHCSLEYGIGHLVVRSLIHLYSNLILGKTDLLTLICDGNNIAHIARHSFSLSNRGMDTSVTYGFLRILNGHINKFKPQSVVICWDGGIPEFRRQAVPEYKAGRHQDEDPDAYEDFLRQMRELQNIVIPMSGMVNAFKRGVEADDFMYHASRMLEDTIVIITTDKDLLQCATDSVFIYHPTKDILYNPRIIEQEFGIAVKDLIDWRAIQGDSSDNIAGVFGIGEKTATKLIQEFGDISGIYNAAMGANPKGKVSEKIASAIVAFGWDRLVKNIKITALYADRVGARQAIEKAVINRKPLDDDKMIDYLYRNAFMSLADGNFISNLRKLRKPELVADTNRFPLVVKREVVI
jgi:5'-3' exonuclease